VLLLSLLAACGAGGAQDSTPATAPSTGTAAVAAVPGRTPVAADDVTARIAAVEFTRQCAVVTQSFADESGFTTDLDDRLAAAGLTHAQWKDWHDALAVSPELTTQWSKVAATGCAGEAGQ
jgi:hypothetical protein